MDLQIAGRFAAVLYGMKLSRSAFMTTRERRITRRKTCSTAAGIGAVINAGVKNCNNQWDKWIIDDNHVCGKGSILRMAG